MSSLIADLVGPHQIRLEPLRAGVDITAFCDPDPEGYHACIFYTRHGFGWPYDTVLISFGWVHPETRQWKRRLGFRLEQLLNDEAARVEAASVVGMADADRLIAFVEANMPTLEAQFEAVTDPRYQRPR